MLVHRSVTPQQYVAGTHLIYTHWLREASWSKGPWLRIGNNGTGEAYNRILNMKGSVVLQF